MTDAFELVIDARVRDLGGGLHVRRVLPSAHRRLVGPFVFADQMGPVELAAGASTDIRPHPHIGLATVTYLFEGAMLHRDSLGNAQRIVPGDVNFMTAGRGIAHSERAPDEVKAHGGKLHGMQVWVALPTELEECAPSFEHRGASELPREERSGVVTTVILGAQYGMTSPVRTASPTFYVHARSEKGGILRAPEAEARAVYVAAGSVAAAGGMLTAGQLGVLAPGTTTKLLLGTDTHAMLLGGAPVGERHVWWNFVSSSEARIEQAKRDWTERRFPPIPDDDDERMPLPEW